MIRCLPRADQILVGGRMLSERQCGSSGAHRPFQRPSVFSDVDQALKQLRSDADQAHLLRRSNADRVLLQRRSNAFPLRGKCGSSADPAWVERGSNTVKYLINIIK